MGAHQLFEGLVPVPQGCTPISSPGSAAQAAQSCIRALMVQAKRAIMLRRRARRRYSNHELDVQQVQALVDGIANVTQAQEDHLKTKIPSERRRAAHVANYKARKKELQEAKTVRAVTKTYHHRLRIELHQAEKQVVRAVTAIRKFQASNQERFLQIELSWEQAGWSRSRMVVFDYSMITTFSSDWNQIFPTCWSSCGRARCEKETPKFDGKNTPKRWQDMCKHLIARHFLHLNEKQLEREATYWDPGNFIPFTMDKRKKFLLMARSDEIVDDIRDILNQRRGGKDYLWARQIQKWGIVK